MKDKEYYFVDLVNTTKEAFFFLLKKWLSISIFALLSGLIAVLLISLTDQTYKANMTFVTEGGNDKVSSYAGIAAQFGIDLSQGSNNAFEGDNILEIFKSRNLIQRTLLSPISSSNNTLFAEAYVQNHNLNKKNIPLNFNIAKNGIANRVVDSFLTAITGEILKNQMTIERKDRKINLIVLEMVDNNEVFAKRFIEVLTENTVKFYSEYKTKKTKQNVDILQRQADSLNSLLTGRITEVAASNDLNVNPLRQMARAGTQRRQVDLQISSTLYGEVLKQLEIAKIGLRKETPLVQIIDTPMYPLLKLRLGRLKGLLIFSILGATVFVFFLLLKRLIN